MDFYVLIPSDEADVPVKREGYSGDGATYWIAPGGVLVAGGFNDDTFRRWRVYAPGTWVGVESDKAPMRPADPRDGAADDPSTGQHFN